jgi:hypothetical protein
LNFILQTITICSTFPAISLALASTKGSLLR